MEDYEQPDEKTIEEHAKEQRVAPSILAAVMQAERWAVGKTVSEPVFKAAVNRFLSAPMGRYSCYQE